MNVASRPQTSRRERDAASRGFVLAAVTTRELILREASRLFAKKGYSATSTREIAEAVGVSQPSLFHHFDSKASILSELIGYNLAEPAEVAVALANHEGPASERLFLYLRFDLTHILCCPYNLAGLDPDVVLAGQKLQYWRERQQALRDARRRMIGEGITSGEFVSMPVDVAHHAVTGLILGVIKGFSGTPAENAEEIAESVACFVLRGLLREPDEVDVIRERARGASPLIAE